VVLVLEDVILNIGKYIKKYKILVKIPSTDFG